MREKNDTRHERQGGQPVTSSLMAKRQLLTSGELAAHIGVSPRTVARYAREGLITPALRTPGGQYRWVLEDVEAEMRELWQQGE